MCYLIAKGHYDEGCIAVKTEPGKTLAALVNYLSRKTLNSDMQILTISNPKMYGEYKPFHFVDTEEQFLIEVLLHSKVNASESTKKVPH